MATRTIDVIFNTRNNPNGIDTLTKSLKAAEAQAQKTQQQMQKLQQIGSKFTLLGGAILAPFILAAKKYMDMTIEQRGELLKNVEARKDELDAILKNKNATAEQIAMAEQNLKLADDALITFNKQNEAQTRLSEVGRRWNIAMADIGKVTVEQILPALETAADIIEKIATFAEENPGAVKAALGIGGTLVVLGGVITMTASLISSIATIQGLMASVLSANAVSLASVGVGGAAGGAGLMAGIGSALLAVMTSPLTWAVAALLLTRPILNWLLGTNQTWEDIGRTGHQLLIIIGYGVDKVLRGIGSFFSNLGANIMKGFSSLGQWIVQGFNNLINSIIPGKDDGGMIGRGLFQNMDGKREMVLNNRTVRSAEQMIGGTLTQQRLLQSLAGGGSRGVTYHSNDRYEAYVSSSERNKIANAVIGRMAKAF